MRAAIVEQPGSPEVLQIQEISVPSPRPGWVLIRVNAFGLNRSEMYTRRGHSPSVRFPRVLGIECVGVVEEGGGTGLAPGQKVAAAMGEMGRAYDGGYAEYTLVPASQVMPLTTDLPWETLAAIPETFLTAWGSLVEALDVQAGEKLLIRGGTSALGMAAMSLAKDMGLYVAATTRDSAKAAALVANGGRRHHRRGGVGPGGAQAPPGGLRLHFGPDRLGDAARLAANGSSAQTVDPCATTACGSATKQQGTPACPAALLAAVSSSLEASPEH
jgi:NADPH:quinone reductase-like Zn-dependent oxidoreductase